MPTTNQEQQSQELPRIQTNIHHTVNLVTVILKIWYEPYGKPMIDSGSKLEMLLKYSRDTQQVCLHKTYTTLCSAELQLG